MSWISRQELHRSVLRHLACTNWAVLDHKKGYSYIYVPDEYRFEKVFLIDGIQVNTKWDNLDKCSLCYDEKSREIISFRDPRTFQFLNSWKNVLTTNKNEVIPAMMDPVNRNDGASYVPDFIHNGNHPNKRRAKLWKASGVCLKLGNNTTLGHAFKHFFMLWTNMLR